ncbi:MAG: hypothetical protein RIF40_24550, partial [Imperialibacter sp.]|uniref:hypothetical protein n=1 Tax=Imperialibacter sp. TaxID=2038411 RepID=UPI0032EFC68F
RRWRRFAAAIRVQSQQTALEKSKAFLFSGSSGVETQFSGLKTHPGNEGAMKTHPETGTG